jgi:quercetin dioxygenase-like cupin family protein
MLYGEPPTTSPTARPAVSDVEEGPLGRGFTVTFEPGQVLPTHRNAVKVVITVLRGNGVIQLADDAPQQLREGDVVRIEPRVPHALEAPTEAMQVHVTLISACCDCC